MSTRCNIAIYKEDTKEIRVIYCHHDGYYSGVGKTLKENYNNTEIVDSLIDNGDVSSLGETINNSIFYMRDINETDCEAVKDVIDKDRLQRFLGEEYLYIWLVKENKWICTHTGQFVDL